MGHRLPTQRLVPVQPLIRLSEQHLRLTAITGGVIHIAATHPIMIRIAQRRDVTQLIDSAPLAQ